MEIYFNNIEETEVFGQKLGTLLKPGDIICLNGDLGAGKTTLTKSIGRGLGVDDYITSPTFTLINEYEGRLSLYHFDVYRLENVDDLYDLGFDEYFYGKGVSIVEWADKIEKFLPKDRLVLDIENGDQEDKRLVKISAYGNRYEDLLKELE